jgi:hypothetical protein
MEVTVRERDEGRREREIIPRRDSDEREGED